jgi:hypothetical protein
VSDETDRAVANELPYGFLGDALAKERILKRRARERELLLELDQAVVGVPIAGHGLACAKSRPTTWAPTGPRGRSSSRSAT